ncbi:MAG: hypothetical protein GC186_15190 [Rhodobacteraceae bacterium]|nr:hypothetical protein [Paracoccaceae bacterium]
MAVPRLFGSVGLLAGAVIALQIAVMRVFAVGSWSHFGSLVVSLAMLGFGLAGVLIYAAGGWLDRHGRAAAGVALVLFGPLAVAANQIAQIVPFNAVFLVSDPMQKWRLIANFLLYLLPFLAGALFLGMVFRQERGRFNRLYFADLVGSGLAGVAILGAMHLLVPERLLVAPLLLWAGAVVLWFGARRRLWSLVGAGLTLAAYLALPGLLHLPALAVSQYKGISYARNFPDARRLYRSVSPYGDLQVYASSYMHFAPGLSDNAAFNVPELPPDSYVGLYLDGDGPSGIMRQIPAADTAYFHYLPMFYPYVLKPDARVFVTQFGGGLSAMTALNAGARSVTVAEANPEVLRAFRAPTLRAATGGILEDPRLRAVGLDGRLYLARTLDRFDVIDLSLADSVGLSNPGGFAVIERYAYTEQALMTYMRALAPGGILAVTLWNKEEPPKSVLRFYATAAAAARRAGGDPARSFFVASSYLSTTTVLYKRGGFTAAEVARLEKQTADLSFDEVYAPGYAFDPNLADGILAKYRASVFGDGTSAASGDAPADDASAAPPGDGASGAPAPEPSTTLARLAWHEEMSRGGPGALADYVFDIRPLTDDRPYFAGYVHPGDLGRTLDRLDVLQDDWGYLLLWATLAVAALTVVPLIMLPVLLGGRRTVAEGRGLAPVLVYFGCLGLGYITVEVGLIAWFARALTNPTISAATVISGMLVFSGFGSLAAERIVTRARQILPVLLAAIALALAALPLVLPFALATLGTLPIALRLLGTIALVAPPAFLMGFPMATAMTWLGQAGRERSFVWAWAINGSLSVVGAAAVPLVAVLYGLSAVLYAAAAAYGLAIPAFLVLASSAAPLTAPLPAPT